MTNKSTFIARPCRNISRNMNLNLQIVPAVHVFSWIHCKSKRPYIDCQQIKTNTKWGIPTNPWGGLNTNPIYVYFTNLTQTLNTNPQLNFFHNYTHARFTSLSRSKARLPEEAGCRQIFSRFDNPGFSFGFICFQSAGAFSHANNLLLPITTS